MLRKILKRFRSDDAPQNLYGQIVAQARQPEFYGELGVPDTLEGRFDMIVLHLVLAMRRLRREGERGRELSQALVNAFFADMDRSLREMGVGDLVVPKRVRRMAEAFYGRASAYEQALGADGDDALEQVLIRNVFAGEVAGDASPVLTRYVLDSENALAGQSGEEVMAGELHWAGLRKPQMAGV
jgi:cytochrome b pre-mRNA-processing protein 3